MLQMKTTTDSLGTFPSTSETRVKERTDEFCSGRFQWLRPVGQSVWLTRDTHTNEQFAVKTIEKFANIRLEYSRTKRNECLEKNRKRIEQELRVHQLSHPFLMSIRMVMHNKFAVYIFMDKMETDLWCEVTNTTVTPSDDYISYYIGQVLLALEYLHSKNILHRDLKPTNILIGNDRAAKLADFGVSRAVTDVDSARSYSRVGTWAFSSPELLAGHAYNRATDTWSLGVMLFWLRSSCRLPYSMDWLEQTSPVFLLEKIETHPLEFPVDTPADFECLVSALLVINPHQRVKDCALCRQAKYFKAIDWKLLETGQLKPPGKLPRNKPTTPTSYNLLLNTF